MAAIGGPVESISIDGREFAVAQDADVNRKLGGDENEIEMNGNGTGRIIKSRVAWQLDGLQLAIDDDLGDAEFLQEVQDSNDYADVVITFASGASYGGSGTITGETQTSSANTTGAVTLGGPGKLSRV